MAIFRVHTNDGYTAMSNNHLRDTKLSWSAMGLLSFMLSCKDSFKFSIEGLSQCSSCGSSATRSALEELKEKKYLVVSRVIDSQGKVSEWQYDIYEFPVVENPVVENPVVENPHVENQPQRNNNISITNKRNINQSTPVDNTLFDISPKDITTSPKGEDEEFIRFYNLFGKKTQRIQALRMWKKLNRKDKDEIMQSVTAYVQSTPDVQYRMNPATYINPANKRWQDELRVQTEQIQNHVTDF